MSDPAAQARSALALAAAVTAGMALWLVFVVVTVLPSHDPASIPLWRGVAAGFFAWAAGSAWAVASPPRAATPRAALSLGALLACAAGAYAIASALGAAPRHFEGWLLLMGVLLFAHGVTAALYAHITRPPAAR